MTLVVTVKVNDGVVLAADSAVTMSRIQPDGSLKTSNVYNNANKVLNLCKGLPLGVLTFGSAAIGGVLLSTLVKDFRFRLTNPADAIAIERANYQVATVAQQFLTFVRDAYNNPFNGIKEHSNFYTGFIIAGYSTGGRSSEEYLLTIKDGQVEGPTRLPYEGKTGADVGYGVYLNGQPEAASRLIRGYGGAASAVFAPNLALPPDAQAVLANMRSLLFSELASPLMPIQDAVDLAEFLLDVTIRYIRFMEGDQTVGGPIELAAITKHEGFKWVRRKYYFPSNLNP